MPERRYSLEIKEIALVLLERLTGSQINSIKDCLGSYIIQVEAKKAPIIPNIQYTGTGEDYVSYACSLIISERSYPEIKMIIELLESGKTNKNKITERLIEDELSAIPYSQKENYRHILECLSEKYAREIISGELQKSMDYKTMKELLDEMRNSDLIEGHLNKMYPTDLGMLLLRELKKD